jgi:hypothetical protein
MLRCLTPIREEMVTRVSKKVGDGVVLPLDRCVGFGGICLREITRTEFQRKW